MGVPGVGDAEARPLWCGELELSGREVPRTFGVPTGEETAARVLVRLHGEPLGYVTVPLAGRQIDLDLLLTRSWEHFAPEINAHLEADGLGGMNYLTPTLRPPVPTSACGAPVDTTDLVTVVVHVRRGGYVLANCLARLRLLSYRNIEVVVVDTAPEDDSVSRIVETVSSVDPRFRYVGEPVPGVASARNRGLAEALGRYVAYTDEEMAVDPGWIEGLLRGFARDPEVACVTGLVCQAVVVAGEDGPSGEPAWSTRMTSEVFRGGQPPEAAGALYPYVADGVGRGLNAAFDREFLDGIGGFDAALGAGTFVGTGEDVDVFARVLREGRAVAYEPTALSWQSPDAAEPPALERVFTHYAATSAILAKSLLDRRVNRRDLLRRIPDAVRGRERVAGLPAPPAGEDVAPARARRARRRGLLAGPLLYARARLATEPRWSPDAAETAVARLVIAWLSLGGLVTGAIALAVGADAVRMGSLLVYGVLGVGSAPWQINRTMRLPARLTLTVVVSLAVLTLGSMFMIEAQLWQPIVGLAVVTAVCLPLHVVGFQLALRDVEANRRRLPATQPRGARSERRGRFLRSPAIIVSGLGAVLTLNSALAHRHLEPQFFGFLPTIGPAWYAGLALVLLGILLARSDGEHELAVTVVLLVVVLTVTPALVYDGPRSQVAAKHVDLVLQIMQTHQTHSAIEIYNAWPGFFAASAWLCSIVGMDDPMRLATFWPALLGLFRVAALRFLFGQFLKNSYQAWVAVVLAVLADSIGADYYSPQSIGFVLGVAAVGLALSTDERLPRKSMIFLAGCVLAVSHQLSPYTVGGIMMILVVFRQVRPWWTPGLVLAPAVAWALVHRGALSGFLSWEAIGRLTNFRPPQTVESPGLARLPVVAQASEALLAGILLVGVVAAVALAVRYRLRSAWALAVCPVVGLILVAINPYGQEGIFRAALFGIPWLAILAAYCFPSPRRMLVRVGVLGMAVVLTATFLVSSFGLDAINVMRPSDVAAFRYFQQQRTYPITTNYVLALGAGDLPTSLPPQTGDFLVVRREALNDPVREQPDLQADKQVQVLTDRFLKLSHQSPSTAHLYAVWSPVSSDYGVAYGLQSASQFEALRDAFRRSPYWEVSFHEGGTYLFRFDNLRYKAPVAP
jgi:glycosyltransferase involved in cell wall biosynthesis